MDTKIVNYTLCTPDLCTGCMACVNSCSHGAITIGTNEKGFYRPLVISENCINCGQCANVCPSLVQNKKLNPIIESYSCWNKNKSVRKDSSSGGFFSIIAEKVIKEGGIVYGTKFDSQLRAVVDSTETMEGLVAFRGSKYVQSVVQYDTFRKVRRDLLRKRLVLFTGTACQIAGLKGFLKKDYENLLTIDFLCHGVPSPRLFQKYLKEVEAGENKKIVDFKFRDKKYSWRLFNIRTKFSDATEKIRIARTDSYYSLFLNSYSLSDNCFNCQYAQRERISDFTMADFWTRYDLDKRTKDSDEGISLVMLNTLRAQELFKACQMELVINKQNLEQVKVKSRYLNHPSKEPADYSQFWKEEALLSVSQLRDKFIQPTFDLDLKLLGLGIKPSTLTSRIIHKMTEIWKK